MPYNVYMMGALSIAGALDPQSLPNKVILDCQRTLQGYFDKIVRAHDALGHHPFGKVTVRWLADIPVVEPNELLVYFLPNNAKVVEHRRIESGIPPVGHSGRTVFSPADGQTGSEVYNTLGNDGVLIANLMFHEFMHNKLNLGNRELHDKTKRDGLAMADIWASTQLTTGNINEMARALHIRRPQWTDGIKMLNARGMLPQDDPSRGLF